MPPLEERTEYAYQNIRTKNYQWGNGDKVSQYCVRTVSECTDTLQTLLYVDSPGNRPTQAQKLRDKN